MASKLSRFHGAYAIYRTRNNLDDPNYDEKNEYKDVLMELIKEKRIAFLIDLHVMANFRREDICIGTGNGKNIMRRSDILDAMQQIFIDHKFENTTVDIPFASVYKHTVCSTISRKCKIPCFQIEINFRFIDEKSDHYALDRIYESLEEIISVMEESCL